MFVFVAFQLSCHSCQGSLFTLAYTKYASPDFHDGMVETKELNAVKLKKEERIAQNCDGQKPCYGQQPTTPHVKQRTVTGHVKIGKGFGLTNAWIPILEMLQERPRSGRAPGRHSVLKLCCCVVVDSLWHSVSDVSAC